MKRVVSYFRNSPLRVMWCVVIACLAIHATTMSFSPVHWIDDVMITEFSRAWFSSPENDCSIVWNPTTAGKGIPASVSYLGGLMLEFGYRAFGHLGPRILTMAWLLILTALVALYVRRKTGNRFLAAFAGILCFTAPCLTQSARGARVDVMAVAFAFTALDVLLVETKTAGYRLVMFALSGVCVALSAFTWLPGLMLAPLVGWEMLDGFLRDKVEIRNAVLLTVVACIAFLIAVAVLLIPFYPDVLSPISGARKSVAEVASQGNAGWHWLEFVKASFQNPFLFAFGFVALFLRRRTWLLAVIFVGLALVCISSKVYVFRMIYLWPYAVVGLFIFCATLHGRARSSAYIILFLMCVASIGWSVLLRNGTECFMAKFRDYDKLRKDMIREIGRDVKIYMMCDHPYYIGRELGWKQYRYQYDGSSRVLFDRVDYVLAEEKWMTTNVLSRMEVYGFKSNRLICTDVAKPSNAIERYLASRGRSHAYGPYRLFLK